MFKNLIAEILPRIIEDLLEQMPRFSGHFERFSEFFAKDIPVLIQRLFIQPAINAAKALTENPL